MKYKNINMKSLRKAGGTLFTCLMINTSFAQFSPGNLVVLQAGDGSAALANTGNAVVLREFSTTGTPAYSLTVPSTGTTALVVSGSAGSEGMLSLSPNNKQLVFGGYAVALPNVTPLANAASSVVNRGIGVVNASGSYSLAATTAVFYSGNNLRAATSDGNGNHWGAGGNDGTDYLGTANPTVNVQNIKANTRAIAIFNNQLYFSTQSNSGAQTSIGIYSVGSGTPTSAAQTITNVINTGSGSLPVQFYFQTSANPTVCYVADVRTTAAGGVQKWVNSLGTWTLAYTLPTGSANIGANGVVADFSGANPMVYATTGEASNNRLISILDIGAASTATTIATATASNTIFRGLAFSPCDVPVINSVASNSVLCANQNLSLTANVSSASSLTYSWSGVGGFSAPTASATIVNGPVSGMYSLTATNGCGSASTSWSVTVNPAPILTITASSASVCPNGSVSLTASGATSYTWSNGIGNGASFTLAAASVYTVTGSNNLCSSTSTVNVGINPLPALNVNSITVCMGQQATLTASGANTYSWNTGSTNASITVTPLITTNYTLTGTSVFGCISTSITQVAVTNSAVASVSSATVCAGNSATLNASGINTYTWSTGANTSSIVVTPATTTTYVVSGGLQGCPGTDSNTGSVTVNPNPTLSISGATTMCAGDLLGQSISGAVTYTINNQPLPTTTFSFNPLTNTVYTISGTNGFGCTSSVNRSITVNPAPGLSISGNSVVCQNSTLSQTVSGASTYSLNSIAINSTFTVNPANGNSYMYTILGTSAAGCTATVSRTLTVNPAPVVSVIPGPTVVCAGTSVTLTATGANTYSWNNGKTTVTVSDVPVQTTTYIVTGYNTFSCSSAAQYVQMVSVCTSLTENSSDDNTFVIFPNPASGAFSIKYSDLSVTAIRIVTQLGDLVLEDANYHSGKNTDISQLAKGVYFVHLSGIGKVQVKKLIVE